MARSAKSLALDAEIAKRRARSEALTRATVKNLPDFATQAPGAVLDALKDAYRVGEAYARSHTPEAAMADVKRGAGALKDAAVRYGVDRAQKPIKLLADAYNVGKDTITAVPQAVGDVATLSEKAQRLKATNPEAARRLQGGIALAALGAIPAVGKGGKLVREAEKVGAEEAARAEARRLAERVAEQLPAGVKRRVSPAEAVRNMGERARAEARVRSTYATPSERRALREPYTIGPLKIENDPALANVEFVPGSQRSVTLQAAEKGVPVSGLKPFSAQHPEGYSRSWGAEKPDPTNFSATYRDRFPDTHAEPLSAEHFKVGSGLYPLIGDATMATRDILAVNGIPLSRPVATSGGSRFGWSQRNAGGNAVWSSGANIVERQAKNIQDWRNANPGHDILGVHVNMGPEGSDFSHQPAAVIAAMYPNLDLPDETKRALDAYIRAGKEGLPDFVGFADDPSLALFDLLTRYGSERKSIPKRLADVTKAAQAAGLPPHLGALARLAVAEPELRLAPQGASGFGVVKFAPKGFLQVRPELLSSTKRKLFETPEYADVLGGAPLFEPLDYNANLLGEVMGRTKHLLPAELLWPDVFGRAAAFTKTGKPTDTGMKWTSFKTDSMPIQTVTPELQDRIGEYLRAVDKYGDLAYAKGGLVAKYGA